jgi:hypothetical protein
VAQKKIVSSFYSRVQKEARNDARRKQLKKKKN